jgi:hypothetical protein
MQPPAGTRCSTEAATVTAVAMKRVSDSCGNAARTNSVDTCNTLPQVRR